MLTQQSFGCENPKARSRASGLFGRDARFQPFEPIQHDDELRGDRGGLHRVLDDQEAFAVR
jgi:hypothetical protein